MLLQNHPKSCPAAPGDTGRTHPHTHKSHDLLSLAGTPNCPPPGPSAPPLLSVSLSQLRKGPSKGLQPPTVLLYSNELNAF